MVAYTTGDAHLKIGLRLVAPTDGSSLFIASFNLGFFGVKGTQKLVPVNPGFGCMPIALNAVTSWLFRPQPVKYQSEIFFCFI